MEPRYTAIVAIVITACLSACSVTKLYTKKVDKAYEKMGQSEWYIEQDSSVVHWRKVGKGNKSIVLIHGFGILPQVQWKDLAKELHEEYTLYIPDLIYFGNSRSDYNQYSPYFQSRQIMQSMEELSIKEPYVAGLSYGGYVAALIANEYQEEVSGLILIDALSKFIDPQHTQRLADSLEVGNTQNLLIPENGKGLKKLFSVSFYDPPNYPTFILNGVVKNLYDDPEDHRASMINYLYDQKGKLQNTDYQYSGPVLIIWGEQDRLIPIQSASKLDEYYPKTDLAVVPNAGHVVVMEKPEEVSEIFRLFLEKLN